jgi:glycosyltransferase involved in cell wall biosynthesis
MRFILASWSALELSSKQVNFVYPIQNPIIPGKNGYMSNVGDVDAMSKQAISILKDDKTLASFKENAQTQALRFDISNIVPQYEELYEKVIAGVPA